MQIKQVSEIELNELRSMTSGLRLKWIREQLQELYHDGFSINQVAKQTKAITPQGLSAIENGKTENPSFRTINALAEYYRVNAEVFFDEYYSTKNKPFRLGDVTIIDADIHDHIRKPPTLNCRISITSRTSKFNETLNLTPKQIENLIKRIEFEINLLKEE